MREILFRAKRVLDGEWFQGSLVRFPDGDCYICVGGVNSCIMDKYAVCEKTIGQYTGLTDKNGVKIFEGDIVDMTGEWWDAAGPAGHSSPVAQVEWEKGFCGFTPFANYDCDCGVYIEAKGCKVIGNIYDNRELIDNTFN